MCKVTIVVPVYNSAQYLERCINSIINQTYKNLEVLIINDGSTDNSADIINKFVLLDNRVKTIHIKNSGVSSARNKGIECATGEYISFIDSDDYIEPLMIEKLKSIIGESKSNVSACGVNNILKKSKKIMGEESGSTQIITFKNSEPIKYILNSYYRGYSCNKLFPIRIITDNNIRFHENIHACEDLLFCVEVFLHTNCLLYTSEKFYNYLHHEGSSMASVTLRKLSMIEAYEEIIDLLEENEEYENMGMFIDDFHKILLSLLFQTMDQNNKELTSIVECKISNLPDCRLSFKSKLVFKLMKIIKYPLYLIWKVRNLYKTSKRNK